SLVLIGGSTFACARHLCGRNNDAPRVGRRFQSAAWLHIANVRTGFRNAFDLPENRASKLVAISIRPYQIAYEPTFGVLIFTENDDHSCQTSPGRNVRKRSVGIPASLNASASAISGASIGSSVSWKVP